MNPPRYDRTTIMLHWGIAVLIIAQWLGAHAIDWFPKGPYRVDARSVHIVCGGLMVMALLYRIYWRSTRGVRFPKPPGLNPDTLAKLVHYALYALMAVVLGLGVFNAWLRGDDIFGLFHIPKFGSYEKEVRHLFVNLIVDWHRLASNILLLLAAGHALVALVHNYILKDDVLKRMALK